MKSKNILVLTSWSYKEGLIKSAVLPYLKIIHAISNDAKLYLVTEEKHGFSLNANEQKLAEKELSAYNISWRPQPYYQFGLKKMFYSLLTILKLIRIIIFKRVSIIHAFCTPAGSLGYILSRFTGTKLIIDSYEPHADSMLENGTWTKKSKSYQILSWFEKAQTRRARWCIGVATGMDSYAQTKWGTQPNQFIWRPLCVDLKKFKYDGTTRLKLRNEFNLGDKIVAVYAGKFGGIYFEREVFEFIKIAWETWGDKFRFLILSNQPFKEIKKIYDGIIPEQIVLIKNIPFTDMPSWLSVADFALTPVKPVPSKRYCSPIKNGEYWAMGLPIVISKDISDDSDIIASTGLGYVLESQNKQEYKNAINFIKEIMYDPNVKSDIRSLAEKYRNYNIAFEAYKKIYTSDLN